MLSYNILNNLYWSEKDSIPNTEFYIINQNIGSSLNKLFVDIYPRKTYFDTTLNKEFIWDYDGRWKYKY